MTVSVIIPCHNGEAFLAETLRAVTVQTLAPDEVIVVDDGSTDASATIAREWGGNVRCIAGEGRGASAARNLGVAHARPDSALMFLDADDLLGPTTLEELARVLEQSPGAIARCPWYRLEWHDGCWFTAPASCADRAPWQDDLSAWLTGWYHPPCSLLWSRTAYGRSGGWNPMVRVNTDGDIIMRALVEGVPLRPTRHGAGYYRRLPGEAVSLSGRRWTRMGVASRLDVLDGIALRLERQGRQGRYAASLGFAYAELAEGARDALPDLRARALDGVARFGGGSASRLLDRQVRWAGGRLSRVTERLAGNGRPSTSPGRRASGNTTGAVSRPRAPGTPLVSVIIPTFNRADLLPRAIDSVLAQTVTDLELIIIDDGSTDGTEALIAGLRDDRIRFLRQANAGVSAARNHGLREARGEFIAFLDSDDEWMADKLALQLDVFARGSERLGLVYTGTQNVGGDDAGDAVPRARGFVLGPMLLENVAHGSGSSAMIRRGVVETVGYFDERMPAIEDYDYWLRIARFYEIDYVPAPLIRYFDEGAARESGPRERRSRAFAANMLARTTFHRRNRHEMRQAGVEHLFLLETARRHMRSPLGRWRDGARAAFQALLARPRALATYAWLPVILLPEPGRRGVRVLRDAAVRLGRRARRLFAPE